MELFKKLKLSEQLVKSIQRLRITTPTLIQEKSIPLILNGKDIVGESATGSGKTLAFGCGIIERVEPKQGIQALVLIPTRELCVQVQGAIKELTRELNVTAVYGGVAIGPQIKDIARSEVIVGTPGRMLDHLQRGTINLSKIKVLVLDEADRMLDMGFIDDVEKITKQCPKNKQTLFFSATIPTQLKRLIDRYMENPERVIATKMVDPEKLKQVFYAVPNNLKVSLLVHLLKKESQGLVMVFCNTRRNTDIVVKNLKVNGISATAIHGGLSQNKRSKTLQIFNKAKVEVLVCTDVAARGLHINDISHVYNYDIPRDANDYVHRIGRTARAGKEGKVVNILTERDHDNFRKVLREHSTYKIEEKQIPQMEKAISAPADRENRSGFTRGRSGGYRGGSAGGRSGGYRGGSAGGRPSGPRRSSGGRPSGPRSEEPRKRYSGSDTRDKRRSEDGPRTGGKPKGRSNSAPKKKFVRRGYA